MNLYLHTILKWQLLICILNFTTFLATALCFSLTNVCVFFRWRAWVISRDFSALSFLESWKLLCKFQVCALISSQWIFCNTGFCKLQVGPLKTRGDITSVRGLLLYSTSMSVFGVGEVSSCRHFCPHTTASALLEKFWRILLYGTNDAIVKLHMI